MSRHLPLWLGSLLLTACGVFDRPIANTAGACLEITEVPLGVDAVEVELPNLDPLNADQEGESTWSFCLDGDQAEQANFTSIFAARINMLSSQVLLTFEQGAIRTRFVNERQFPVYKNRTRETTFDEWTSLDAGGNPVRDDSGVPWAAHRAKLEGNGP